MTVVSTSHLIKINIYCSKNSEFIVTTPLHVRRYMYKLGYRNDLLTYLDFESLQSFNFGFLNRITLHKYNHNIMNYLRNILNYRYNITKYHHNIINFVPYVSPVVLPGILCPSLIWCSFINLTYFRFTVVLVYNNE